MFQFLKCGYCGELIRQSLGVLSHECLKHYDEEKHLLSVDDNFVATIGKNIFISITVIVFLLTWK